MRSLLPTVRLTSEGAGVHEGRERPPHPHIVFSPLFSNRVSSLITSLKCQTVVSVKTGCSGEPFKVFKILNFLSYSSTITKEFDTLYGSIG